MNIKTTLILLLLLAVVGVSFYLMQQRDPGVPTDHGTRRGDGQPVFSDDHAFTPDQVTAITLERDGETIELARVDHDWHQVAPVRFRLNNTAGPANIAEAAATLTFRDRFTPGEDGKPTLDEIRLTPPAAVVTLTINRDASDGEEPTTTQHTIRLSRRPIGGRGFAQIDDQAAVHVVTDALHNAALAQSPRIWRARSLDAPSADQTHRVRIVHDGTEVLAHKDGGDWYLGEGRTQRADRQAIAGLLDAVKALYIREFTADAPQSLTPYGLDQPTLSLAITRPGIGDAPERTHTLNIGGAADLDGESFYATWITDPGGDQPPIGRGVVFSVRKNALTALRPGVDDLRDPRITPVRRAEITALRIERDQQPIDLVRDGSGYRFADDGPGYSPDRQAIRDLLDAVLAGSAVGYLPGFDSAEPSLATITIQARTAAEPDTITVYPADDPERVVTVREGETVGYQHNRDKLQPLFEPLLSLRDRTIATVDLAGVQAITVERPDGRFHFTRQAQGDDKWSLQGADGYDAAAFESLRNLLISMRAQRWLDEPADAAGAVTLTVERAQASPLVFHINPATGRASRNEEGHAFVLPDAAVETISAEFRVRDVFRFAADVIETVEVRDGAEGGDDAGMLIRRDAGRRYVDGEGDSVDQSAAAGLYDTLAGLEANRFVPADAVKIALDRPTRTLTITTRDAAHTLAVWAASQSDRGAALARLDDGGLLIELAEEDAAKLLAPVAAPAAREP